LQELQQNAAGEFASAGFPGRKTEAWKYTPLRVLENRAPAVVQAMREDASHQAVPESLSSSG
jgi:hypothetical protein